jgi:DNA-directed RNA polymerase specialized sigma24 family protein
LPKSDDRLAVFGQGLGSFSSCGHREGGTTVQRSFLNAPIAMNIKSSVDLSNLLLEAREYPVGSPQRQQRLTYVIRQMQRSGKIWRDYQISVDQYNEALQQTWVYFCQNLNSYDPTRANPLTWFNCILKFRIKDLRRKTIEEERRIHQNFVNDSTGEAAIDLIDRLPAPDANKAEQMLNDLLTWLNQERSTLEQKSIRNHAAINVYTLIARRLPTEHQVSWQTLSQEFGVSVPTLSSFYQRQCIPLLREFSQVQGWLEA